MEIKRLDSYAVEVNGDVARSYATYRFESIIMACRLEILVIGRFFQDSM